MGVTVSAAVGVTVSAGVGVIVSAGVGAVCRCGWCAAVGVTASVQVCDLGLAQLYEELLQLQPPSSEHRTSGRGTTAYMPPEVASCPRACAVSHRLSHTVASSDTPLECNDTQFAPTVACVIPGGFSVRHLFVCHCTPLHCWADSDSVYAAAALHVVGRDALLPSAEQCRGSICAGRRTPKSASIPDGAFCADQLDVE